MTRMIATSVSLRTALAVHLPVLKRSPHFSPLNKLLLVAGDGSLDTVSTDRFMAAVHPIKISDIEDPRRFNVTITLDQALLLSAYLRYIAPAFVNLRLTDVALTLGADTDTPLTLKVEPAEGSKYPDILPRIVDAFREENIATAAPTPKSYRPHLISHIRDVELWATGSKERNPSTFRAPSGTFGVIMSIGQDLSAPAAQIRENHPTIFEEETPTATVTEIRPKGGK